jgi:signal transduction histidine kinase/CheY-like chemotaxis protein
VTRLRVLHLEDSRIDAELVREMLATNGLTAEVERVETRDQYVAMLDRGGFDLIIADYSLPAFDGLTALELARKQCPEIPFLFVTGALKDDSAVETLRRGATDFIVKQRLVRLVPAIQRAIREREERQQRARAEASLQFINTASARLAASLDLSAILGNLSRLAIPTLADFCVVELYAYDGDGEQFAAAHIDNARIDVVRKLRFCSRLIPGGMAELYDVVPEERLKSLAINREQLDVMLALAPRSLMLVPLVVGGRILGSIALGISESSRRYDGRDLATAKSLAERAAVAIENARLYRELQREVKSRKDLLAIVSHDLRNPMQNILMTATMLEHQMAAGDPLRARVENIAKSSALASRLLADLLDLARFEAGNLVLDRRVQDLAPIVRDSIDLVASLAEHKRIKIVNGIRPGTAQAFCDHTRVSQILGNLLGNALKFTPDGGTISINARSIPERAEVQIGVTDTGVGIAARDVPHLFERYWQARTGGGGVGLGLSIVKALVEAQDGKVSVSSDVGRGSTFSFTLSTQPVASDDTAPTVLVVDDDAETRISVAQVLEEAGYRTLTAGDGLEALELLRRQPQLHPALILLDLQMPKMDARAFCQEQQRDPALKDIAVIVFSAGDDVAEIARQLHASGHLHKPVGVQDLLDAVGHCVPVPAATASADAQLR